MMYDAASKGTGIVERVRNKVRHDASPGHISRLRARFGQAARAPAGQRTSTFLKTQGSASKDASKGWLARARGHLHGSSSSTAATGGGASSPDTYSSPGHTYDAVSDNQSAAKSIV